MSAIQLLHEELFLSPEKVTARPRTVSFQDCETGSPTFKPKGDLFSFETPSPTRRVRKHTDSTEFDSDLSTAVPSPDAGPSPDAWSSEKLKSHGSTCPFDFETQISDMPDLDLAMSATDFEASTMPGSCSKAVRTYSDASTRAGTYDAMDFVMMVNLDEEPSEQAEPEDAMEDSIAFIPSPAHKGFSNLAAARRQNRASAEAIQSTPRTDACCPHPTTPPPAPKMVIPVTPQNDAYCPFPTTPPPVSRNRLSHCKGLKEALRRKSVEQVREALLNDPDCARLPFFDHHMEPPLCCAVQHKCSAEIVRLLLENDADPELTDLRKRRPADILKSFRTSQQEYADIGIIEELLGVSPASQPAARELGQFLFPDFVGSPWTIGFVDQPPPVDEMFLPYQLESMHVRAEMFMPWDNMRYEIKV